VAAFALAIGLAVTAGTTTSDRAQTAAARTSVSGPAVAPDWVVGWGAALAGHGDGVFDRTVRMIVHDAVPGSAVRLQLSNRFGSQPLVIGAVDVAAQAVGGDAVPGSTRQVTFSDSAVLTIPAGAEVTSDPVAMTVSAGENLLVSIYFPGNTGPSGWHRDAREVTYFSAPGDFAAASSTASYRADANPDSDGDYYYLDGLDVWSTTTRCTLVTFGDSITNGNGSAMSASSSWPDDLARRLAAVPGGPVIGVVDEGLDGNQLVTDTRFAFGLSGLHRFGYDALDQPGVKDVIVLEGINDIGTLIRPTSTLTAQDLIDGYLTLIREAHADGVKIYGATILPYEGAFYYTPAGEAIRETVNNWILTSGAFDGVFDFAAAVQDPFDPFRLNPAYDSGDHLHPNDAGYQAMADSIDLSTLSC
jgi:lysophospholipase L1-like esterase